MKIQIGSGNSSFIKQNDFAFRLLPLILYINWFTKIIIEA